jgi:ArsR family transcriptional regulator, arsenate/arsenite/antimonite-responsive transcriptional repressor
MTRQSRQETTGSTAARRRLIHFNNRCIVESMDSEVAIRALAALAQEHRLAIFRLLVKQGTEGMAAGEIGERIGISPTSTSFHLKELDRAGLITARREGRFIRYAFSAGTMRDLLAFLTEDCCQGRPELCGDLFRRVGCQPGKELVDE